MPRDALDFGDGRAYAERRMLRGVASLRSALGRVYLVLLCQVRQAVHPYSCWVGLVVGGCDWLYFHS